MKFVIVFFAIIGAVLACNQNADCVSCTTNSGCFYDNAASSCKSVLLQLFTSQSSVIPLPYDCPTNPPGNFQYSDDFGRNRALVFAMASNGLTPDDAQICLTNRVPDAKIVKQYTVVCDWFQSNCSAILALNPKENSIVVAFRGTKGATQFFIEAINLLVYQSSSSPLFDGKVFTYFANAFDLLWTSGLASDLQNLKNENPSYELWTFGHSLGGSLATLAANAAVKTGIFTGDKVKVVTMGEPRTGDYTFAQGVSKNVPGIYRIVHGADLVTKLPLKLTLEQKSAYHTNFEVWYNNDMAQGAGFVVNNRADDQSGSNTVNYDGKDYHNNYFNVDNDNYHLNGCL
uniref:Fungal lipase-like domain-containing protein n=1 Tax=Panagrolaimus sp. JU765 TaxID=591449 RepID=A0AC34Q0R6_9BILA